MRAVADEQLDDRVDEVLGSRRWVSGEPNRSSTVTSAPPPRRRACAGSCASPSPSHQCRTTIGSSTTTPGGTCTNAPPARNASCSTVNASGDASEHAAEQRRRRRRRSHVARPQTRTPFASSAASSSWCTTRPSRTTTSPARSPASAANGPPPGARSSPGCAELARPGRAGSGRGRARRSGCSARSPPSAVGHARSSSCSAAADAPPNGEPVGPAEVRAPRRV